jgi:hypothetical protein
MLSVSGRIAQVVGGCAPRVGDVRVEVEVWAAGVRLLSTSHRHKREPAELFGPQQPHGPPLNSPASELAYALVLMMRQFVLDTKSTSLPRTYKAYI